MLFLEQVYICVVLPIPLCTAGSSAKEFLFFDSSEPAWPVLYYFLAFHTQWASLGFRSLTVMPDLLTFSGLEFPRGFAISEEVRAEQFRNSAPWEESLTPSEDRRFQQCLLSFFSVWNVKSFNMYSDDSSPLKIFIDNPLHRASVGNGTVLCIKAFPKFKLLWAVKWFYKMISF